MTGNGGPSCLDPVSNMDSMAGLGICIVVTMISIIGLIGYLS